MATAILKIGEGNFENGFPVTLHLDNPTIQDISIILPSNIELLNALNAYRDSYHIWGNHYFLGQIEVPDEHIIEVINPINENFNNLKTQFNNWLTSTKFTSIRDTLIRESSHIDKIFIQSKCNELQMLPWDNWQLRLDHFSTIEIAMSNPIPVVPVTLQSPVQILFIFTVDIKNINEIIIKNNLPGFNIIPLESPGYENFCDLIEEIERLDILIFVGHSHTIKDFTDARIELRPDDFYTINSLQYPLRIARKKGVKLIIFNSCDGCGIITQLNNLNIHIPYIIVHREPVHIYIAQEFLKRLLIYFRQGNSLDQSLRQTREYLIGLETYYPNCASLPLLFAHPDQPPLYYPQPEENNLSENEEETNLKSANNPAKKHKKLTIKLLKNISPILVIILLLSVILARQFWLSKIETCKLTPADRLLSCGEKSLMETPPRDKDKKKGIEEFAHKNFDQAIKSLQTSFDNNKDGETLIFLNNAQVLQKLKLGKINQNQVIPLAVVIPITKQKDGPDQVSEETLKGIGYKQKQFNENNNQNQVLILVANDENNVGDNKTEGIAQQIALQLVKRKLYAVIGHYSSRATIYTKDIYKKAHLVLMSFASVANEVIITDNKHNKTLTLTDNSQNTYFFRVLSTNKDQTKLLAQYLQNKGYQKVVIFYSEKIFSLSFKQEFERNWSKDSVINTYNLDEKIDTKSILNNLKNRQEKIAIILCPDAFTNNNATSLEISNTKDIIKENNGQFLIGSGNVMTLYEDSIYTENTNIAKNIVISVPWSDYSEKINQHQRKQIDELKKFWGNNLLSEEVFRQVIAYDSTKVLLDALSQLSHPLSSSKLQKYLVNPNNKFDGMSGEITFKGSDRLENTAILITPNCDANSCQGWKKEWE